jgi:hypothetical protein
MSKETTYAGKLGSWQQLVVQLLQSLPGLIHLEPFRIKLEAILARAVDIGQQQTALTADKQELSKDLQGLISDGERLAGVVRKSLREHYGFKSEKLAAFGMQPFRGRKAKDDKETPAPAPVLPASAAPRSGR